MHTRLSTLLRMCEHKPYPTLNSEGPKFKTGYVETGWREDGSGVWGLGGGGWCEDRVMDGPASGEKDFKGKS